MQKLWWKSCQAEIGVKWQFWDVLEFQSFGRFRTGRNLDLWDPVWVVFCQLSRALHCFHFYYMTRLWVSCARKPLWPVLQFCEGLCMRWQLDLDWVCGLPQVCTIFVLSETLKFGRSHITCQDVRHASWGSSECDLCRKCESSVKVCVTHLRMNKREFVLGMAWNGWVVTCMVSRWIVKLNCRLCPSCIWAPAYPRECIRPCLGDSNDSCQRTCQLQQPRQLQQKQESFPCLRIHQWRHEQEMMRLNQRKRESRTLLMCMEKTRKTERKEMLEEMMIDRDLQGWECMSHLIPVMLQTCWTLLRAWLWESLRWSLHWRVRRTSSKPLSRVRILFSRTFAEA